MRTYVYIGCLVFLVCSHVYKTTASPEPDLFLEDTGSGDDVEPVPTKHKNHVTEEGSGKNDYDGGGTRPHHRYDDEDDDDDYYSYDEEYDTDGVDRGHEEGSGYPYMYSPPNTDADNDAIDSGDDISLPIPRGGEADEEFIVDHPVEEDPSSDHMPSTTPPTMTEMENSIRILTQKDDERQVSIFAQPGILAAFIGGAVMGLLCAILLVMFIVYRMRKRDEGSYPLDEPKRVPLTSSYSPNDKEIYA